MILEIQQELARYFSTLLNNEEFSIYDLNKAQKQIIKWNYDRNNTAFNLENEIKMLKSEAKEGDDALDILVAITSSPEEKKEAEHEVIDSMADVYVVFTGTLAKTGLINLPLDAELVQWMIVYNEIPIRIKEAGYNFSKVMEECLKEINSRKQDPEQAKLWLESGKQIGEKWLKDKNQDSATLYKADYTKCKL